MEVCSFLVPERLCTSPRNRRVWLSTSWRCCPTTLFNQFAMSHAELIFFISARFAEAAAACRNLSTQKGERAMTTAVAAWLLASLSATTSDPAAPIEPYDR